MFKHVILLLIALTPHILAIPPALDSLFSSYLSKRYLVKCWEFSYSASSPWSSFAPIVASDCLKAAQQVACEDDIFEMARFSRDPDSSAHLPYTWANGTCKVKMDITAPGNLAETTTFLEIRNRVLEITRKCVMSKSQRGLGGYSTVGNHDLIHLTVSGNAVIPDEGSVLAGLATSDICRALRRD